MNHNGEIRVISHNYAGLGSSESNDNIVQAAEEPMAEGAISRPTSQASIRSNNVSSKCTYGKVHPSILDVENCNWENTTAGIYKSGGYETSLPCHKQGDRTIICQAASCPVKRLQQMDRHRVLKDAKAQVATTHQPPPQAPPTTSLIVESAYADTLAEAPHKKREPSPISPTYASVDPPSSFPMPATTR